MAEFGSRKNELGGSLFYDMHGELGANVPSPDLEKVKTQIYAITDCIEEQLFLSCHDISDGGLAVAISEMTFGNNIGCDVVVPGNLALEKLLFSETGGFIIETEPKHLQQIKNIFKSHEVDYHNIGSTSDNGRIRINDAIDLDVKEAKSLWSNGLRDKIK